MANDIQDKLKNLSKAEREYALKIMREMSRNGNSQTYKNLLYSDYEEIPVDIETFLKDDRYLGKGLVNSEGKFTIFPYWLETLKKIFPTNIDTAYNTVILTGAIGLGKSQIAVLCQLYLLYRMLCLKDPYIHYGLMPSDKITFSQINVTIDMAKGVAWDKIQQLLQSSSWFMSKGYMSGTTNLQWNPPKGIELIVGSNNNHIMGRAIFCSFEDEVNFDLCSDIEKAKKKELKLITQVEARMLSRFLKNNKLPTLNLIASSKQDEQSFLESYIRTKRENNNQTTLIIDEPQWVVRPNVGSPNDEGAFYVAVGSKTLASELLPRNASEEEVDSYRRKGYKLLKVPPFYYNNFLENIDVALTDLAGISTSSSMKYISGVKWNAIKTKSYKNPFTKEEIEVGNAADDTSQYSDYFDLTAIDRSLMRKPLYIHLDMSMSGDCTGIAGVWILGKKKNTDGTRTNELYYKLAFDVAIKAPKGFQVSFDKNREFIRWLRKVGFNVCGVSSDTFQSAQIQQQLARDGFNTSIISVDRLQKVDGTNQNVCLPYQNFKACIYERLLIVYDKCDKLTDEVIQLERLSNGKIEHENGGRSGSKDISDAVCGALYNASQNAETYAFDYSETAELVFDSGVNTTSNDDLQDKRQAFQQEMAKLFTPNALKKQTSNPTDEQLSQYYLNDGIIVI